MSSKILVVAAHPDDEILGCGGTIARLAKNGSKVHTLILGEGAASRYEKDEQGAKKQIEDLKKQAHKANQIIGVKEVHIYNFPDNKFDTGPLLNLVKVIEQVKAKVRPNIIFTHYEKDLNIDHQITYKAVITAARPLPDETVKEIYAFEVLSSTEWGYPLSFSPDVFFNISETLDIKMKALGEYKAELREFPHPRSLEAAELNAKTWGMKVGVKFAEAFKCVRCIK
jgi:LmbE family N-acetylglucosaminyl deacetylase